MLPNINILPAKQAPKIKAAPNKSTFPWGKQTGLIKSPLVLTLQNTHHDGDQK